MTCYLLDTNAINSVLDMGVEPRAVARRGAVYVTHIQIDELGATKRPERLEALLKVLEQIAPESMPTAAAIFDVSKWGEAEFGDAGGLYQPFLEKLNARNHGKRNNLNDALIGVTALRRDLTLVTDDKDLSAVVTELGGRAISFCDFLG